MKKTKKILKNKSKGLGLNVLGQSVLTFVA